VLRVMGRGHWPWGKSGEGVQDADADANADALTAASPKSVSGMFNGRISFH